MNKIENAIEIKSLYKDFRNGNSSLSVLSDINLSIPSGTSNVILGKSGSGKSTLLHLIGGLDKPTKGKIISCGKELNLTKEKEITHYRKNCVGFIFQFHFLLDDFTVTENLIIPAMMNGMAKNIALKQAYDLLENVGLNNRLNHFPGQLSGGEKQRTALARALMNNPDIILADEPTGSLDEENSAIVEDLLFSLVRKFEKTLVFVTHDTALQKKSDASYLLTKGNLEVII